MKLPKMHIADSVVNRILNNFDDFERGEQEELRARSIDHINTPELEGAIGGQDQGAELDSALAQPTPEMPEFDENPLSDSGAATIGVATGGNSLDGLLDKT